MITALQPQQLESVAKDEDPIYGPLSRARGKVERGFTGDEEISPDLADLLSTPCELPNYKSSVKEVVLIGDRSGTVYTTSWAKQCVPTDQSYEDHPVARRFASGAEL